MNRWVDISFRCVPLRSVPRMSPPLDATNEVVEIYRRLREAAQKHGFHNSYYLHDGKCVYHLTNHEQIGMLEFRFEGTVLTDATGLAPLSVTFGTRGSWMVRSIAVPTTTNANSPWSPAQRYDVL